MLGCDIILTTPVIEDWISIRRQKKTIIDKNKQNKHKNQKPHKYRIHEKVLVCDKNDVLKITNHTNIEYMRKY